MKRPSTILVKDSIDTIAIGGFDGIHVAHMQLIDRLGENGALFVIERDHANLTPGLKRIEYSKYPCLFYHFSKVKDLSGEEFVKLLKKEFSNLKKIVVGYDFVFGKNRSCGIQDLKELFDGKIEVVEEFFFKGVSVHSSVIREYLLSANIDRANMLLGREYSIIGSVVVGQGLGEKELYPTINIVIKDYLVPSEGVYASRTKIQDKIYNSASFIGVRASTDGSFSIETHIIDRHVEECSEVEIFFVAYLRDNIKFNNLKELKAQIGIDIVKSKAILDG